jgi:glycosyltransferase involved in cell wall biosynthesis
MAKIQPLFFSIIIPTLNEQKCLPLLLEDLKTQSYNNFEIIIVDGQSKDKTQNIVRSNPTIKLLISDKKNVGHQRNLGGFQAKGQYLIFLDADSRIPVYFLEGIKYRTKVSNPDIFTCWADQLDENSKNKPIINMLNLEVELAKKTKFPIAFGAMMVCNRRIFNKHHGFDENIRYAEDTELVQRFVKNGYKFEVFKDPKYYFSLRRLEKEGSFNMFRKYASVTISLLINSFPKIPVKDYPMLGGTYYDSRKKKNLLFTNFEKSLNNLKRIKTRKDLIKFWENIFLN